MSGKSKGPMKVAEALAGYLTKSGLGERLHEASAVEEWAAKVGPRIAAVTEPLHVNNGVLFVGVRSSAWLMELRMLEGDVRRRLNEGREKGRIRKIRFVIAGGGEESPPGRRGAASS